MSTSLALDIIIPSYNRAHLLKNTLQSIDDAIKPAAIDVGVIVVDNNSTDATKSIVQDFIPRFDGKLRYVFEAQQGRSFAINAGIRASQAGLIGTIDDDEEIDPNWICEVAANFEDPALDFLGGACLPKWGGLSCPDWLPESHRGLIGWIVQSDRRFEYGAGSPAYMVGGNAVVRRSLFGKAGLYHTSLGRTGSGANGGEDLEIFGRFIAANGKGCYSPNLIIYHHIPAERLKQSFFRRRAFWDGVSIGFISRENQEPVPHIGGIPRYFLRMAGQSLARRAFARGRPPSEDFADELRVLELFGRAYGRYVHGRQKLHSFPSIGNALRQRYG